MPRDGVDPAFRAGLDRYGAGRVRSLSEFYKQAGLEPVQATLLDQLVGNEPMGRWAPFISERRPPEFTPAKRKPAKPAQ